jgi:hypothetical protein
MRNPSSSVMDVPFQVTPGIDLVSFEINGMRLRATKNARDNFMSAVYHVMVPSFLEGTLRVAFRGYPRGDRDSQSRSWGITDEFVMVPYPYPRPIGSSPLIHCAVTLPADLTLLIEGVTPAPGAVDADGNRTWTYTADGWQWIIAGRYNEQHLDAGGNEIRFVTLKGREAVMEANHSADTVVDG